MSAETKTVNPMRNVFVEKVVLNCGCGTDHARLDKSLKLLEKMAGKKAVKTITFRLFLALYI